MKKVFYLFVILIGYILCSPPVLNAQGGVAINPNGSLPDNSAGLDLNFNNKGFLMPRLTTAERNAIVSPASGLVIYNTDCSVFNFNAGTPNNPNWATLNSSNVLLAGVTITASPAGAICAGTSVTFSATPSQNNLSPTYQWQVNGANVGTNSTTYTTSSLSSGDVVSCILSSSAACVTGSPATSNAITVLVNIVPTITGTTPTGFCSGSAVTLAASANLGTINWYENLTGGSSLATGASFTTSGLTSTTTYYVDATANGCTSPSRTAVTATFYPNSPGQPGAITGPTAENRDSIATYSISELPNTAFYTWSVPMGVITSGQGSTSITVMWGDSSGAGSVSVVANNACGTSTPQILPVGIGIQTFSFTGGAQSFTVPNGITSVAITAYGAAGGGGAGSGAGGLGGSATGTLTVTPGEVLQLNVGGAPVTYIGGWNGGGTGGNASASNYAGGGGGASDVRTAADLSLNGRVIVAGGGGGYGNDGAQGGDGGGTTGSVSGSSQNITNGAGGGGTQNSGGSAGVAYQGPWPGCATNGNAGSFGTGGDGVYNYYPAQCGQYLTGAGGGGWYGGGSGATSGQWAGGSGGGGSGYIGGVNGGSMQSGVRSGNGQIILTW